MSQKFDPSVSQTLARYSILLDTSAGGWVLIIIPRFGLDAKGIGMATVDFHSIRVIRGTAHNGFEELCCQLASHESPAPGSQFIRNGTPDGGVEAYRIFADGTERGWQAKYFFLIDDSQWVQMDESVLNAIDKHPNLKNYTICLPIDLPDSRISRHKTLRQKWNARVKLWRNAAKSRGMDVDFELWGEHELLTRLSREEHAGKLWFFFSQLEMSQRWFLDHIDEVMAAAEPRYSPELNIELPISLRFESLSYTRQFRRIVNTKRADYRVKFTNTCSRLGKATLSVPSRELVECFQRDGQAIMDLLDGIEDCLPVPVPILNLPEMISKLNEVYWGLESALTDEGAIDTSDNVRHGSRRDGNRFYQELRSLEEFRTSLYEMNRWYEGHSIDFASRPALLLCGQAGNGKTHLFCDIARRRIQEGLPAVVILGEQMGEGNAWDQIRNRLGLNCTRDVFLGALQSAAEAADSRAVIFIDAINEATEVKWWTELPSMLKVVGRFPRVAIALSCRSTYVDVLVRKDLWRSRIARIDHDGFGSSLFEALTGFCRHYRIESMNTPPLNPEFENPLFLKLFCKGLNERGLTRPPRGHHGIQRIFSFYIDSVEEKLSAPTELDYPVSDRVVSNAMAAIADAMFDSGGIALEQSYAKSILDEIWPTPSDSGYSKSLLKRLIAEGLLADDYYYPSPGELPVPIIRFGYERLADFQIARRLLERHGKEFGIKADIPDDSSLGKFISGNEKHYQHAGIMTALVVLAPEFLGRELSELLPGIDMGDAYNAAFIEALPWRDGQYLNFPAIKLIEELLDRGDHASSRHAISDPVLEKLIQISAQPDHPMNADWLHGRLSRMAMPERDLRWSTFLHRSWLKREWTESGPIPRLLEWAWPINAEHVDPSDGLEDDVVRLVSIILAWCFTTSDRYVRDRATKGLVSILRSRLHLLPTLLDSFLDVDDPYVHERLMCAAYGCVMRSNDRQGSNFLARYVYDHVFADDCPPTHLLTRDYARGIVEYAIAFGGMNDVDASKIRPPYQSLEVTKDVPSWTETKIQTLGQGYNAISLSLFPDFGDFARYVIGSDSSSGINGWSSEPDPFRTVREIENEEVDLPERLLKLTTDVTLMEFIQSNPPLYTDPDEQKPDEEMPEEESMSGGSDEIGSHSKWLAELREERERIRASATKEELDLVERNADVERRRKIALAEAEERYEIKNHSDFPCRWIAERLIELGWTPELFGKFDNEVNRNDYRDSQKAERIGKKYQWIAYCELYARTVDHKPYHHSYYGSNYQYYGPWQTSTRDIDPSFLVRSKKDEETSSLTWWAPLADPVADVSGLEDADWLTDEATIPDFTPILQVRRKPTSDAMFTLKTYMRWRESDEAASLKLGRPRRDLTFSLNAFVVAKKDVAELARFAGSDDCGSMEISEPDYHYRFLGEFPWAPSFEDFDDRSISDTDESSDDVECQLRHLGNSSAMAAQTVMRYVQGSNDFDCSRKESIPGHTPSAWLARRMGIRWAKKRFQFMNSAGKIIGLDPSHEEPGPACFLIDSAELIHYLDKSKSALVWLLVGEKLLLNLDGTMDDDRHKPRITVFRRMYHLKGNVIKTVAQTFRYLGGDIISK
ncbi:hypothetical protein TA3x_001109 [Tundrisphaera sp. TA3]|uniref:hypothetical protein n=1 Tax=Tundrisphaera sp. TA3 TaxID=3435775 RepID=UPI003EB910A9